MSSITLPTRTGTVESFQRPEAPERFGPGKPFRSRALYAAPHVVADLRGEYLPGVDCRIDIERTVEYRRFLWSYGVGVAEAMSTTERYAVQWPEMKRLIEASAAAAKQVGGKLICGIDTDQYEASEVSDLAAVTRAYLEQLEFVESHGLQAIIRGSRHLARLATTAADYAQVYRAIFEHAARPVLIHWSGAVFQPLFERYWGSADTSVALETLLALVMQSDGKVSGLKVSLLDVALEKRVRDRLPEWCQTFTGDDYHYDELLLPDPANGRYSQGLLGILDAIAPLAADAMVRLDAGDLDGARETLRASVPLSKIVFEAPAGRYPCGIVFLAHLNGFQDHFRMVSGTEGFRSIVHYADVFRAAAAAGLLRDWDVAVSRFRPLLESAGISQKG